MKRPPEAQLIYDKREHLGLSVREAARRAGPGVTEGSWRRTEKPGDHTRTARTVARMAQVVGITPSQLRMARRPDAAAELEALPPLAFTNGNTPLSPEVQRAILSESEKHARRERELERRIAEMERRLRGQNGAH